jgi:intracellular septation protein
LGYDAKLFKPNPIVPMQILVDYLPILIFFGAYFYEGIYFATAVLMAVMPVVLVLQWIMTRKLNKIYAASTLLVLVLGTATLLLRNPQFLYWKPTVLNWAIALVFLGSQYIGAKPMVQRMLESAAQLQADQWRRLNMIWVVFFVTIGGLNLYVAYTYSESTWVKFKLFGMLGITVVFIVIQTLWLTASIGENDAPDDNQES